MHHVLRAPSRSACAAGCGRVPRLLGTTRVRRDAHCASAGAQLWWRRRHRTGEMSWVVWRACDRAGSEASEAGDGEAGGDDVSCDPMRVASWNRAGRRYD